MNKELVSLDITIANFVLPRLIEFRKTTKSIPPQFDTLQEWRTVLDDMIYGIEYASNDANWYNPFFDSDRVHRGLRLFGEYFLCLWM